MAVSIDRVYQKVLAFANKEQRGYITPQEFNLFADQAQMEIFEQYFYDINQWTRQHGNSHEYSDMLVNLEEKIDKFAHIATSDNVTVLSAYGDINLGSNIYRLGDVRVKYPENNVYVAAEEIRSRKEYYLYESSQLAKSTRQRPIYHRHTMSTGLDRMKIYPYPVEDDGSSFDISSADIDYSLPNVLITDNIYYNASGTVNAGHTGRYASFDGAEMNSMLGAPFTNEQDVDLIVERDGAIVHQGILRLFNTTENGTHLRRGGPNYSQASTSDWLGGERLFLPGDIFQDNMRNVQVDYIRKPTIPNWSYVVVNDKALYNSTNSIDFELHLSEESELVYRILAYAGIAIEKPQLTQMAASLEQAKVQQEKQ